MTVKGMLTMFWTYSAAITEHASVNNLINYFKRSIPAGMSIILRTGRFTIKNLIKII